MWAQQFYTSPSPQCFTTIMWAQLSYTQESFSTVLHQSPVDTTVLHCSLTRQSVTTVQHHSRTPQSYTTVPHHSPTPQSYTTILHPTPQSYITVPHHSRTSQSHTTVVHHNPTPQPYTTVLHHSPTPQCYTTVLHLSNTPQSYTTVVHHSPTPQSYTSVIHHSNTSDYYATVLHHSPLGTIVQYHSTATETNKCISTVSIQFLHNRKVTCIWIYVYLLQISAQIWNFNKMSYCNRTRCTCYTILASSRMLACGSPASLPVWLPAERSHAGHQPR